MAAATETAAEEEARLLRLEEQPEHGGGGAWEYLSLARRLRARRPAPVLRLGLALLNDASARSRLAAEQWTHYEQVAVAAMDCQRLDVAKINYWLSFIDVFLANGNREIYFYCPDMFRHNRFITDCGDDLWIWLWAGMAFGHGYGILIITTRAMPLPFIWISNNYTSHEHEVSRIHQRWLEKWPKKWLLISNLQAPKSYLIFAFSICKWSWFRSVVISYVVMALAVFVVLIKSKSLNT